MRVPAKRFKMDQDVTLTVFDGQGEVVMDIEGDIFTVTVALTDEQAMELHQWVSDYLESR